MKYDAVIIGAGPAGLFAAIQLGYQNKKVLVVEKNNQAGKKLLISGAGKCNITHDGDIKDFANHYGDGYKYIKTALNTFTNIDTINFLKNRGLPTISMENGKIFPKTRNANDVVKLLVLECSKHNVDINYNQQVKQVTLVEKGFIVKTSKASYGASFVVIATGGMSYPKTGSTGDGYKIGAMLGHDIITPRPALTPIESVDFPFSCLAGMSFEEIPITIWRDNKKVKECVGDILFTHKGLSGPGILNYSRWMEENDILCINFIKATNIQEFAQQMLTDINSNGKNKIKTILKKYNLPKRLLTALLDNLGIDEDIQCGQINREIRKLLIQAFTEFPVKISKLGGFHIAMVTAGGINMKQINPTTMESRITKNLYFIGEVLDVDGNTGGYNIQAALSTAMLCANSIQRKENL